jgi:hypothetical protein
VATENEFIALAKEISNLFKVTPKRPEDEKRVSLTREDILVREPGFPIFFPEDKDGGFDDSLKYLDHIQNNLHCLGGHLEGILKVVKDSNLTEDEKRIIKDESFAILKHIVSVTKISNAIVPAVAAEVEAWCGGKVLDALQALWGTPKDRTAVTRSLTLHEVLEHFRHHNKRESGDCYGRTIEISTKR